MLPLSMTITPKLPPVTQAVSPKPLPPIPAPPPTLPCNASPPFAVREPSPLKVTFAEAASLKSPLVSRPASTNIPAQPVAPVRVLSPTSTISTSVPGFICMAAVFLGSSSYIIKCKRAVCGIVNHATWCYTAVGIFSINRKIVRGNLNTAYDNTVFDIIGTYRETHCGYRKCCNNDCQNSRKNSFF